MFRLSPSSLPLLRTTLLALFRSFSLPFSIISAVWVLSVGEEPLDSPDFPVCNGPSAITVVRLTETDNCFATPAQSHSFHPTSTLHCTNRNCLVKDERDANQLFKQAESLVSFIVELISPRCTSRQV